MTGQETSAVRQELVAIQDTTLKESKALSSELPNDGKFAIQRGTRMTARFSGDDGDYWIVAEASISDNAIPSNLRYVYKNHWKLESGTTTRGVANEASRIVTEAGYAATFARRRRLYAGFRRRLAQH